MQSFLKEKKMESEYDICVAPANQSPLHIETVSLPEEVNKVVYDLIDDG